MNELERKLNSQGIEMKQYNAALQIFLRDQEFKEIIEELDEKQQNEMLMFINPDSSS